MRDGRRRRRVVRVERRVNVVMSKVWCHLITTLEMHHNDATLSSNIPRLNGNMRPIMGKMVGLI